MTETQKYSCLAAKARANRAHESLHHEYIQAWRRGWCIPHAAYARIFAWLLDGEQRVIAANDGMLMQ